VDSGAAALPGERRRDGREEREQRDEDGVRGFHEALSLGRSDAALGSSSFSRLKKCTPTL
jgi:hypothetical protein